MNEIYLIGLGNPGKKYYKSRHNIGFLLLEKLSKKHNLLRFFQKLSFRSNLLRNLVKVVIGYKFVEE